MTAPLATPLPPEFIPRDPVAITAELVELFQTLTGRVLQPAQVERVLVDVVAYRETLLRLAIQDAAEQSLVAFARGEHLDRLGELVGVTRLAAAAARITLQFTLSGAQLVDVVIPAGTIARSADGSVRFATLELLIISAGALSGQVSAAALTVGAGANGFLAGTIAQLEAPIAGVAAVTNTGVSMGGADVEPDDRYRDRIRQAPQQYSVAGSAGAYRYFALSVSSTIVDVAVSSSAMGLVRVCVLVATGAPGSPLLTQVYNALSADRVRPLSDTVLVVAAAAVTYAITATIRPRSGVDPVAMMAAAQSAAQVLAADRASRLGRDVLPSQVVAALSVAGVYDVTLTAPAAAVVVGTEQFAQCTGVTLTLGTTGD